MKRYLAYWKCLGFIFKKPGVYEIEVTRETPKMFYYRDWSYKKKQPVSRFFSGFYSYHSTREEARDALVEFLEERESDKLQNVDLLKREARELRGLINKFTEERK